MARLPLDQGIPRFKANEERIDLMTNGGEDATWRTADGTEVPSVRKMFKDINTEGEGWLALAEGAAQEAAEARDETVNNAPWSVKDEADFWGKPVLAMGARYRSPNSAWDIGSGAFTHPTSGMPYSPVAIAGAVDPRAVGSPCDGVGDDTPFVHTLWAAGFDVRATSKKLRLNRLKFVDGRKLLTEVGTCIVSSGAPFEHGNVGWREQDLLDYAAVGNLSVGQRQITFDTPRAAGSFVVGDTVFMRGETYHNGTSGGVTYKIYDWSLPNRVTAVVTSGSQITGFTILNPIDEGVSGAMVSNVSKTSVKHITTGDDLYIAHGVVIDGFDIDCEGVLFSEGGGLMNSRLKCGYVNCDSYAFTNTWDLCEISALHVDFKRHWFELALGASRNRVYSNTARLTTNPTSGKRPVRLSEGSRHNEVICGDVDLSLHANGDPPLYLTEGRGNYFKFGRVLSPNAYPRIFNFGSQALPPNAPRSEDNTLEIGLCIAGAGASYGQWVTSGGQNKRNKLVKSVFRGALSSSRALDVAGEDPEVIDVRCESGGLYVQPAAVNPKVSNSYFADDFEQSGLNIILSKPGVSGLMSPSWSALAGQDKNIAAVTISTDSSANVVSSQTIPAGALRIGDMVEYEFSGTCTGAADTANVELWLGGAKAVEVVYAAAENGSFFVRGTFRVQALTALRYQFERVKDVSLAVVGSRTVSDVSANPLTVELRAYRTATGAPAGTLVINSFKAKAVRAGR